ncbi:hypothetical protein N0V82_001291 [Gnomoniopsis sp. IMI 355080]|nr:hypothetical protein N0V82_001291 [Gnomoniopsis sp. IMI 355080]
MRGILGSVAVLYILASLLLIQVLATPEIISNAAHSRDLNIKEAAQQSVGRGIETLPPGLPARGVSRTPVAAAERIADAAAEKRWEKAHVERDGIAERDGQAWTTVHLERGAEPVSSIPVAEEQHDGGLTKSSLVLRSAAPKVFGISIYLIIAWLALMYLMYRTGSF